MRVSELIQKLNKLKDENSDYQVMIDDLYAASVDYDSTIGVINIKSY